MAGVVVRGASACTGSRQKPAHDWQIYLHNELLPAPLTLINKCQWVRVNLDANLVAWQQRRTSSCSQMPSGVCEHAPSRVSLCGHRKPYSTFYGAEGICKSCSRSVAAWQMRDPPVNSSS